MDIETSPDRWRLSRAGIVNVYQYENETLHFRGGRLLLRGVNGSGKSTAMNMLLPFLVDADPRRIDAAGQQTGVLASWMLSGRDEQQPVGYLWIEFGRGDEWFVCGCGIRANRSTGRVTTWWFATDRRPGVDFALVEGQVPRSVDALRATLGPAAVFADDQRPAYRAEVRRRLFGGAELDQHISLLHVMRSPRVGDQIERDLPDHLTQALPELSETAIADAAQPLDDLDDHRRNVEELSRTNHALAALTHVYQRYARTELRRRADDASELVAVANRRRREEGVAATALSTARGEQAATVQQIGELERKQTTLDNELVALRSSDAYREGANLVVLRKQVQSLDRQIGDAVDRIARHAEARAAAATSTDQAHAVVRGDLDELRRELDAIDTLAAATHLAERPPDAPSVDVERIDGEVDAPAGILDVEPTGKRLTAVRSSAQQRTHDVADVRRALDFAEATARELTDAQRHSDTAARRADAAVEAHIAARQRFDQVGGEWAGAVRQWLDELRQLDPEHTLDAVHVHTLPAAADLVEARDTEHPALFDLATALAGSLGTEQAALAARTGEQREVVATARATLGELEARQEPEPPTAAWQTPSGRRPRFADLVDFADHLSPAERAGLEAAMEAAGLLGAELAEHGDGAALLLDGGDLVVAAGAPVADPLSALLVVTLPAEGPAVDQGALASVLGSISSRPGSGAPTAVAVDGTFRIGTLHGRHHKPVAEYVGATARRALLERQRTAAREALAQAEEALAGTQQRLGVVAERREAVERHRKALPALRPVDLAAQASAQAEANLADARAALAERLAEVATAEERVAEAEADLHRRGATLHLPVTADELARVAEALGQIGTGCDRAHQRATAAMRSFGAWTEALGRWRAAVAEHAASREALAGLEDERDPLAMQLATLEDSIGLDFDEVLRTIATSEADLELTRKALAEQRKAQVAGATTVAAKDGEHAVARQARLDADARCVRGVGVLRNVLATPGLVAAAQIDPLAPLDLEPDETVDRLPTVDESVDGLRTLAAAVLAQVPEPSEGEAMADGVRNSLRQRRDTLAAGWDAEDRQPNPDMPMTIDVVGPVVGRVPLADALTRVGAQLRDQESLLSQKQNQALRNLLQGLIAREVAERLQAATELVQLINRRLGTVTTSHGVGVRLRWRQRDDLDTDLARTVDLLAMLPDLRSPEQDDELSKSLSARLDEARRLDGEASYRELIRQVLDYRQWFEMHVLVRRPGRNEEKLTRRTPLSEGEKKLVTYLPLFAAVAASCDGLARNDPGAARFLVLDDAFAKVSEDNHPGLFGLLVDFDLDFIATSERLWGTHSTVPSLAITEVLRDADLGVILLEHFTWDGTLLHSEP